MISPVEVKEATIHQRLSLIALRPRASSTQIGWLLDLALSPPLALNIIYIRQIDISAGIEQHKRHNRLTCVCTKSISSFSNSWLMASLCITSPCSRSILPSISEKVWPAAASGGLFDERLRLGMVADAMGEKKEKGMILMVPFLFVYVHSFI